MAKKNIEKERHPDRLNTHVRDKAGRLQQRPWSPATETLVACLLHITDSSIVGTLKLSENLKKTVLFQSNLSSGNRSIVPNNRKWTGHFPL